jgi:nucleoid-associated protein YgaU
MSNLSVLAFDEIPRGQGGRGATEQIARLLDSSEIDAPSSLYDEALTLAKEGRFAPSTDRLRMLLTLDPIDSEASLLLGKVLAARGQWQEALQRLDAAQANGANVPNGLRERVENSLRNQIQDAEEHRLRVAARERSEIRNLRAEAKRLRSDNAVLDSQVQGLYKRVRLWSSATALVSGCAAALLLVAIVSGGPIANADSSVATTPLADAELTELAAPTVATEKALNDAADMAATGYQYGVEIPATLPQPPTPAIAEVATVETAEAMEPVNTTANLGLPTTHTVVSGDTLGSIALQHYGKSSKWRNIRDANSNALGGGIKLSLGMDLNVPALTE